MEKNLKIVYEDAHLIVVDKPGGMLTMSTGKAGEVTAYSMLTEHVRNSHASSRHDRVFIVHRIDRDTSGLIVFAKDEETKHAMQDNWNRTVLSRKYIAILEGNIESEEGWIETWLYENPKSMKVHCIPIAPADMDAAREGRCRSAGRQGWKYAASHCRTKERGTVGGLPYTKVEFELETGRKNQIRVHSQWIGHPIAGDRKYGAQTNPFGRLALHAATLEFIHPWTGKTMRFSSRLPQKIGKLA